MHGVHAHTSTADRRNYGGIHLKGSEGVHRNLYKPYLCWQHASPPASGWVERNREKVRDQLRWPFSVATENRGIGIEAEFIYKYSCS